MKLSNREFNAMNTPIRRLLQRFIEYPNFKRMGLQLKDQDVLEIGCGSGYGALLLSRQRPKSYIGIDIMPEQIKLAYDLAKHKGLDHYEFRVQDATNLSGIPDKSKDVVVIFGILHHIPGWQNVIQECERVLRDGGKLFIEEPDGGFIANFDRIFHWGHPENALFRLHELEDFMKQRGFDIQRCLKALGFGVYATQKI